jgi:tRNA nucleotidyltransferase/poly(A) polymerase
MILPTAERFKRRNHPLYRRTGKRVIEDPLRILRAERFARKLGFIIEEKSLAAMNKYRHLLAKLNPDKVREEENKGK